MTVIKLDTALPERNAPPAPRISLKPQSSESDLSEPATPSAMSTTTAPEPVVPVVPLSGTFSEQPRPALSLHPISSGPEPGVMVKIQPPRVPNVPSGAAIDRGRAPCDIVLVIDVSGSMATAAPAPGNPGEEAEDFGMSILDLTKHAACTILETLDERDRLGIVTYSSHARTIQPLIPINSENKAKTKENIDSLEPIAATNMWHGIREGLGLFKNPKKTSGRVPAMMLLTDGLPNYMCPRQGYIPKMREMGDLPASIYTFGFGYSLKSGLLKSIAELTGGSYSFIPDAGMIGTVFVHAVANLQATYATDVTLRLTYPTALGLEETMGDGVQKLPPVPVSGGDGSDGGESELTIMLGSIQYGQSRVVVLAGSSAAEGPASSGGSDFFNHAEVKASLTFSRVASDASILTTTSCRVDGPTGMSDGEIAYHQSRSLICAFLASLFPLTDTCEHGATEVSPAKLDELKDLITHLPSNGYSDEKNQSLVRDLSGEAPEGQISLAIRNDDFYSKWGVHFLPSLLNAHERQICISFKDPGPLQYGTDSPLFIACRDRLDSAFDNIPPPKPSRLGCGWARSGANFSISKWNNARGVCFAGSTLIRLASGRDVPIRTMRRGAVVQTPLGVRRVAAVLVTPVDREVMCRVGNLIVTPWHPVSTDSKNWVFPAHTADSALRYTGCIYSLLLQPDPTPAAHAIQVGGRWGVTLGHGLVTGRDVRSHAFFGDYHAVVKELREIGLRRDGIVIGGGIRRDEKTGLVCGLRSGPVRIPPRRGLARDRGQLKVTLRKRAPSN